MKYGVLEIGYFLKLSYSVSGKFRLLGGAKKALTFAIICFKDSL